MNKIFKSKLFWVSVGVSLVCMVYYVWSDVGYAVKQFYATGSESFTALPQSRDDLPTVSNELYLISQERKGDQGTGTSVFLIFYLATVSIVAIWRATKTMEKKGKRIALRLVSFILGPLIGTIGGLAFLLGPTLGAYSLAQVVILRKAGVVADRMVEELKTEKGREKLDIISDEEEIFTKIKANPLAPAIINDDDSFTNNLVITIATTGKNKTAFESVAIPQALYRKNEGNALFVELRDNVFYFQDMCSQCAI
ncbi:MAG: hypothetical protein AAB461_03650 [Patescibacteria group bacterium]